MTPVSITGLASADVGAIIAVAEASVDAIAAAGAHLNAIAGSAHGTFDSLVAAVGGHVGALAGSAHGTIGAIVATVGIYVGTLIIGALSSVVPIVSIEVFLVALAVTGHTGSAASIAAIVALAALGQVIGKLPIYYSARGIASLPGRHRAWIDRFMRWVARFGNRPLALIATSAFVGLPPFSICSTAAGALAIEVRAFCAVIGVARAARFVMLIAIAGKAL